MFYFSIFKYIFEFMHYYIDIFDIPWFLALCTKTKKERQTRPHLPCSHFSWLNPPTSCISAGILPNYSGIFKALDWGFLIDPFQISSYKLFVSNADCWFYFQQLQHFDGTNGCSNSHGWACLEPHSVSQDVVIQIIQSCNSPAFPLFAVVHFLYRRVPSFGFAHHFNNVHWIESFLIILVSCSSLLRW